MAVYFYADLLPHHDYKAVEDNASGSSPTVCAMPPGVDGAYKEELGWRHWLVPKLLSVVKYLLFGAFVLVCSKLRRVIRAKRKRNSSSSSSVDGVDDVSYKE